MKGKGSKDLQRDYKRTGWLFGSCGLQVKRMPQSYQHYACAKCDFEESKAKLRGRTLMKGCCRPCIINGLMAKKSH